jgi:hypothetical protein
MGHVYTAFARGDKICVVVSIEDETPENETDDEQYDDNDGVAQSPVTFFPD